MNVSITSLLGIIWIIMSLATLAFGIAAMFDIWTRNLAGKGRAYFAIIVGVLPMLCLIHDICLMHLNPDGEGYSAPSRSRVSFTATEQREIDKFLEEYGIYGTVTRDDLKKSMDVEGNTLLHHAVSNEQLAVVMYLISKGADVNVRNRDGWTPLHWAAHLNKGIDVARFLIARGANLNAKTKSGDTPLEWARHMDNTVLIRYLESMSRGSISRGTSRSSSGADRSIYIEGTLTLDGVPVQGVSVILIPRNAAGHVAGGITNARGKFTVTTGSASVGSGARAGEYDAVFFKPDVIPKKYNDPQTSGLEPIKIDAGGKKKFSFSLVR